MLVLIGSGSLLPHGGVLAEPALARV